VNSAARRLPPPSTLSLRSIAFGATIVVLLVAAGVFAVGAKIESDSCAREERLVANGMQVVASDMRNVVADETIWDEAVRHLDGVFDRPWAMVNLPSFFLNQQHFGLVSVFDAAGDPIFASLSKAETSAGRSGSIAAAAAPLIVQVRRGEAKRGAYVRTPDRPPAPIDASAFIRSGADLYLISASLVQPENGLGVQPSLHAPIVVVGERVDARFVEDVAQRYLLRDVVLLSPGSPAPWGDASIALEAQAPRDGFRLAWKRDSPTARLALTAGAPLAVVFLALAVSAILIIQSERRNRALAVASQDANLASEAKSAFLATMSHEIRTPLNGILGMAAVMANDVLLPRQRERLEVVRESGASLLTILNDVLDLSRIESGKLRLECTPFDLDELADDARRAFAPLALEKGLRFRLSVESQARGIYEGDPLRLRQILNNLVSNALKFTDRGEVGVRIGLEGAAIRIEVSDTGVGIDADRIEHLFQKFVQADSSTTRRFGGAGLGLAICRELAEAMGGRIAATSQAGAGSQFNAILPLRRVGEAATPAPRDGQLAARLSTNPPPGLRVLVAEDDAVNQIVVKALLAQAGIEPVIVGDGAQALAAWQSGDWDLILMDVQMPQMDGPTATRRIRDIEAAAGRPRTPIIALTANVMNNQMREYVAAGMNGFVAKPIELAKLYAAIDAALAASRGGVAPVAEAR
jgi:signal transduction histidine kinase/ActR/RegA family two-component response regulator